MPPFSLIQFTLVSEKERKKSRSNLMVEATGLHRVTEKRARCVTSSHTDADTAVLTNSVFFPPFNLHGFVQLTRPFAYIQKLQMVQY